ncbi:MAG: hypothetical protein V5A55_09715 [Halovenus sp.]
MMPRTVRDGDGNRYVLLKESTDSSLVRNPETGERRHVSNEDIEYVDDEGPLESAARHVSEPTHELLGAVPDERALGLLVELEAAGPMAVRALLGSYDLCESDLHGSLVELQAGGMIAETTVAGERGYEVTERARELLDTATE